ncbi:MAG: AAA family ATPase [Gemmatimonadetes bacterium SCN 70-22]|nr:MAG: AAA family ATPase [Gemmatimonadetes bacterium SCN 70-22]
MPPYTPRVVETEIDELMSGLAAVALEGPKGVGKTATAERRATTIYRMDDDAQRQLVSASPKVALQAAPPVLIDEWQRLPQVWDAVRRSVDEGASPGRYLLTGSALPADDEVGARPHSGAGRIVSVRMRPMSLAERGLGPTTVSLKELLGGGRPDVSGTSPVDLAQYAAEVVASGLPGIRSLQGRARRAQLDGYLERVVNRDVLEAGHPVRKSHALRRWMTAYAAASATTTTLAKIRDAATSGDGQTATKPTIQTYREVLERLYLLDPVPGWTPSRSHLARLVQAPRHHLADPALAARLLGADEGALLAGETSPLFRAENGTASETTAPRDGTLFGQLFESLVTLSVRVYAQAAEARVRHLRMQDGRHEVDLIVERADHRVVAIEVKLSASVEDRDVRHLLWLREQLGKDLLDAVIVTTGEHAYRRADGIAVVPAALLGV